jgi:hypothetical protein
MARWSRVAMAAGLVLAGAAVDAGSSAASATTTPSWSIQTSAIPWLPQGTLAAVSCAATSSCMAVGSSFDKSNNQVALAESFSGGKWSIKATPSIGAQISTLAAVSCSSATACMAVGELGNPGFTVPLAETWDGSKWKIHDPVSQSSLNAMNGVSCTAANACTAVGFVNNSGTVSSLIESWNGSTWTVQTAASPSGAVFSQLRSVSCTAASVCTAVGQWDDSSSTNATLVERRNGGAWTIQSSPNPSGGGGFSGVSCSSATACTAVGPGPGTTLAEAWNGTAWSIQAMPQPDNALLTGVSCTSATDCTAVGSAGNLNQPLTLAEHWDGSSWTVASTPNPANITQSTFGGVSCNASPSPEACVAVGDSQNSFGLQEALAERWNGTSWSIQATPDPKTFSGLPNLMGVSCTSSAACTAVGYSRNASGTVVTLAEAWNGSKWTIQPTPKVKHATSALLNAVSCTGPSSCTAVGNDGTGSTTDSLAETWNGSKWSIQATPGSADSLLLKGVSCTSSTSCEAVGYRTTSGGVQTTLAEAWDGSSWTVQSTPNPAGAGSPQLVAVSCTATGCIAVGYVSGTSTLTLAERWNGTSWSIQTPPNPSGATSSYLTGVSCQSVTVCVAVGGSNATSPATALAEGLSGTTWTIQPTPTDAGRSTAFAAVSCTSSTSCIAVGYTGGAAATLAESWNGSAWSVQTTPDPGVSTPIMLNAVSCTAATVCTAVGSSNDPPNQALIERYS